MKAAAIALDADGNVLITGSTTNASGDTDVYTAKYANNSTPAWEHIYAGPGNGADAGVEYRRGHCGQRGRRRLRGQQRLGHGLLRRTLLRRRPHHPL